MSNTELSLSDSIRLKGIALLLLLFHHLFYISNGLYDDFTVAGVALVETISQVAKLCVALFVFLSGYGLMASTGKLQKFNWRNFYVKGFTKLYLNYWFMWLMFVPVGIFVFGRTFKDVYQVHVGLKWFIDFFGFSNSFGYFGYNATWWFYSCILLLYLLFPVIRLLMKSKYALLMLLGTLLFMKLLFIPFFEPIRYYLFAFALGIYLEEKRTLSRIDFKNKVIVNIFILLFLITWRQFGPVLNGIFVDSFLVLSIIVLYNSLKHKLNRLGVCLSFFGKHSFNIFLFHTFIFYYYYQSYIYYLRNPFLIFFLLLSVCLILSVFLEYLKNRIGIYHLQKLIIDKLSVKSH